MPRFWIGPAGSLTDAQADARPSNAAALPPCALALALACALSAFPAAAQNPNNTGGTQVTGKTGSKAGPQLERTSQSGTSPSNVQSKPCGKARSAKELFFEGDRDDVCDEPLEAFVDVNGRVNVRGPHGVSFAMTARATEKSAKVLADAAARAKKVGK